jgi:imidazoleglycerol-phosphate dehydratase
MAGGEPVRTEPGRSGVRVQPAGGPTNIETGVPVLDHLVALLASYAGFGLALQVEPGSADAEVAAAGAALGEGLRDTLRDDGARGYGSAAMTSAEALAQVVLEASDTPLVVSNVDLTEARLGGLGSDLVARFLQEFASGARLTLHVRLVNGSDTHHVLEAIFKALGVALAQASSPKT